MLTKITKQKLVVSFISLKFSWNGDPNGDSLYDHLDDQGPGPTPPLVLELTKSTEIREVEPMGDGRPGMKSSLGDWECDHVQLGIRQHRMWVQQFHIVYTTYLW
jgi:hypothetical protein